MLPPGPRKDLFNRLTDICKKAGITPGCGADVNGAIVDCAFDMAPIPIDAEDGDVVMELDDMAVRPKSPPKSFFSHFEAGNLIKPYCQIS